MFAVVKIGSQQFKVAEGDVIDAGQLKAEAGKDITLDQVLLVVDGDKVQIGTPFLSGAKITAKVIEHHKGPKGLAYAYRKRKNSARTIGFRQRYTALSISKIAVK